MGKIKDLNPFDRQKRGFKNNPFFEYQSLLANNIKISNVDFITESIIKGCLFDGCVGYDKLTNKWTMVAPYGLNDNGTPTNARFIFRNGKTYSRELSYEPNEIGAYIIYATPFNFSFNDLIEETTSFMAECDVSIKQNLKGKRTPMVMLVKDEKTLLSLEHIITQKEDGKADILINEDLADGVKGIELKCEYIADKITTLKYDERDRLLNKLGIMSANVDKKERVQTGEVNATLNQCFDYIYLLIDTFNKQMESYGLDFKMSLNGALEELYSSNENKEILEEKDDIKND